MDAMVAATRPIWTGEVMSLAQLGYSDVGLDDCWQACGSYGPNNYTYHDASGNPIVDTSVFPDLKAMTDYGHAKNLTVGWYGNNCRCSDHCNGSSCYEGDVNALIAYGFDSVKLDGCGQEYDLQLWWDLMQATGKSINVENCHWGDTLPVRNASGFFCPYNFYRSSTDARPVFGSVLWNLNTIPPIAAANLSVPGCHAYPDMLEVGVTNTQSVFPPLSYVEARSNFGAWAIVSSPLILGMNVTDGPTVDAVWDIVSNTEVIAINQQYAGFSGSMFAQATTNVTFVPCNWFQNSCDFPVWQYWYKPLVNGTAVLLMNNGLETTSLTVTWADVPGLSGGTSYHVRDVFAHQDLGVYGGGWTAEGLVPHDSALIIVTAL